MFQITVVARLQDYAPRGQLTLMRQNNGDIVVSVSDEDGRSFSVGFTEPNLGGTGSPRTAEALQKLLEAMEQDNADPNCQFRAVQQ